MTLFDFVDFVQSRTFYSVKYGDRYFKDINHRSYFMGLYYFNSFEIKLNLLLNCNCKVFTYKNIFLRAFMPS